MKEFEYVPDCDENMKIYVPGSISAPAESLPSTESDEVRIYSVRDAGAAPEKSNV